MIIHSCWVIKIEDRICLSVWLYSKTSCHHGVQNPWPSHEDIPSSFGIYWEQCQITTVAAQLKQSFAFRTSGLRFVLALRCKALISVRSSIAKLELMSCPALLCLDSKKQS
jgi:hypothetical protein